MTATSILSSPVIVDWEPHPGDVVETVGLVEAPQWNGKRGVVLEVTPDNGRCLVRFRVAVESNAANQGKQATGKTTQTTTRSTYTRVTRKKIKPENLMAYSPPLENDPRVAFVVDGQRYEVEIEAPQQTEEDKTAKCVQCGLALTGHEYFVTTTSSTTSKQYYCEQHFVQTFISNPQDQATFSRWCPICQDYIPIRDGVPLPPNMLETGTVLGELYPHGTLPNNKSGQTSLIFDNSLFGAEEEPYWAHRDCFTCTFCGKPFWDAELTPHGFQIQPKGDTTTTNNNRRQPLVECHCASKPGTTHDTGCAHRQEKQMAALDKLQDYLGMSIEQLQSILEERNISIPSENNNKLNNKEQLIQTSVVTDPNAPFNITGHYYKRRSTIRNSIIPSKSVVLPPPAVFQYGETALLLGPDEAPGSLLLNPKCCHGLSSVVVWEDTTWQREKRTAVSQFIEQHRQEIRFVQSNNDNDNDSEDIHRKTTSSSRFIYTSFHVACNDAIAYFANDPKRYKLLQSDIHEAFIPRLFWAGAVNAAVAAVPPEGGCDYIRLSVAASLVTQAMLTVLREQSQHQSQSSNNSHSSLELLQLQQQDEEQTFDTLSSSISNLLQNTGQQYFEGLLEQPALAQNLQTINTTAHNLFHFMHNNHNQQHNNSDNDRRPACDCLKYIATAASLGDSVRIAKPAKESGE